MKIVNMFTLVGFVILALSSCSVHNVKDNPGDEVSIEIINSETHTIVNPKVIQEGDELLIFGKVEQSYDSFCMNKHWVDVAILTSDRSVLKSFSLPCLHRSTRNSGWHGATFRTKQTIVLPKGALVRFVVNANECYSGETFQTDENKALPKS